MQLLFPKIELVISLPPLEKVSKAASEIIPVIVVSNLRNTIKILKKYSFEIYIVLAKPIKIILKWILQARKS